MCSTNLSDGPPSWIPLFATALMVVHGAYFVLRALCTLVGCACVSVCIWRVTLLQDQDLTSLNLLRLRAREIAGLIVNPVQGFGWTNSTTSTTGHPVVRAGLEARDLQVHGIFFPGEGRNVRVLALHAKGWLGGVEQISSSALSPPCASFFLLSLRLDTRWCLFCSPCEFTTKYS